MINIYKYFTIWSLLISYSILIWSIFIGIPKWLFLFALSLLTMTSIMGTFFITLPAVDIKKDSRNITKKQVILEDSLIHSGPLIAVLLFFGILSKNTIINSEPQFRKSFIFLLIFVVIYYVSMNFEQVYESFDYFTLLILSGAIFASSYQIYVKLL